MPPSLLPDLTPLRRSAEFRRLYTGFTLSNIGSQMAVVAVGLQVYDQTGSTAAVGVVGLFALVPLVVMGLYGGSLADHHDLRGAVLDLLDGFVGVHRAPGWSGVVVSGAVGWGVSAVVG